MDRTILRCLVATNLLLLVLAEENVPPEATLKQYYTYPENTTRGTILFNFTVKYSDGHRDVVVETISDKFVQIQRVNGSDGVWNVILNTDLDREYTARIPLDFLAKGDLDLPLHTELFVQDVNDNAPTFQNLPYTAGVKEDASVGTTVDANITATDPDTGQWSVVSYHMTCVYPQSESASVQGTFVINPIYGNVILHGSLDYETTNFYHYIVTAMDGGGLSSTADLFITVQDVQDTPPFFTGLPYIAYIDEDAQVGTSILTAVALDGDRGINVSNPVTYNISQGSCTGLFQMNSTGTLSVVTKLDRDTSPLSETNGVCSFIVQATEVNKHPPQMGNTAATATVTITIRDINDNPPIFSNTSYTANIRENSPSGVPLTLNSGAQITVSDNDQGDNSAMKISLLNMSDTFELEQSSIQGKGSVFIRVKSNSKLNYEESQQLFFEILARDTPMNSIALSASATVTVNIDHVNEFAPEFNKTDFKASVPEGSPPGYPVFDVQAYDRDIGGSDGQITYSLQNDEGIFNINKLTGKVTVASNTTDRETTANYILLVQAQDGGGLLTVTSLKIIISDANDNPPVFRRNQYEAILSEGEMNFTRPLRLEATDEDEPGTPNSNITYRLLPSSTPSGRVTYFQIKSLTGELVVVKPLDFDTISFRAGLSGTITLTAEARDQGNVPLNSTVDVTITLLDINDNPPKFSQQLYSTEIKENAAVGALVLTVNASDADGSAPNNLVSYFIESGAQDRFRINATSGEIRVSGHLDREETPSYLLNIVARDQAENPKSSSSTVNISLSDVNDENPTFGERSDVTIDVNETSSGQLYVMTATDPDLSNQFRYSIVWTESTGQSGAFTNLNGQYLKEWIYIDNITGTLSAILPLNKTATRKFSLVIQVEDINAEQPKPQKAKGFVRMNILDINNNPPRFSPSGSVTAIVTENSVEGTALILHDSIHVADLDENENSQFELTVEGQFAQFFEVYPVEVQSSADVIIRVKNNTILDYETQQSLDLRVTARETHTTEKRNDSLVVHVTIQDENDYSPVFTNDSYDVAIPENSQSGVFIRTVHASDGDRSQQFNTVTYSLPDSNGLFRINSSSGVVTVAQDNGLDYEKRQNYSLTVEATDGGGRRDTATLIVHLTDINDNPPIFDKPEYSAFVTENKGSFDPQIIVKATDADAGINKEIEYFILDNSPLHQNFTVNNSTGQLGLVSPVDYEFLPDKTTGVVTLLIGARDHGAPSLTTNVSVVVTVKDVNDCTPGFNSSLYSGSIPEIATAGSLVTSVSATDADGSAPNNAIFFVLGSGGSGNFRVDSTTGEVTVALEAHLDRETTPAFNLTVLVLDRGEPPTSSSATVTVTLTDVNDDPPVFLDAQSSQTISEGAVLKKTVATMTARDKDSNPALIYELVKNDTQAYTDRGVHVDYHAVWDWFAINPTTGDVYVNSTCDRETAETVVLVLQVTDNNGSVNRTQTATAKMTITLDDMNDNSPNIYGPRSLNVSEAVTIGTEVASFTATDRDKDQTVTFSIPDTSSSFRVTADGKISLQKSLDRESQDYVSFTLVATDSGSPALSSNVTVSVSVIDANDNAPNITNANTTFFVFENATLGTFVALLTAVDRDAGGNGRVSFGFEDDVQDFNINSTSGNNGTITVKNALDREKKDTYTLSVVALDNPTSDFKLRSTKQIEIKVLDVNDNAPEFHPPNTAIVGRVVETAKKGERVSDISPEIKVTDKDSGQNAELTYQLTPVSGNLSLFTIDAATGSILVNEDLTGMAGNYSYILTVTDCGDPPMSTTASVTLKIIDVNLNAPRFVHIGPVPPVPECLDSGRTIYNFSATDDDKDKDTNGKVEYFLDNTTTSADDLAFFQLDRDSGVLTLAQNQKFDRETKSHFVLRIIAKDKGLPSSLSTLSDPLTININDTNDNSPQFHQSEPEFAVDENKYNTVVGSVLALDPDTDAVTCYEIEDSEFADHFAVHSGSQQEGVIMVVKPLDREKKSDVTITVKATDCTPFSGECNNKMPDSSSLKVQVHVKDVNDNPPIFTSPVISAGFLATSEYGTEILNLQELVTDPDLGENRKHTFYPVGPIDIGANLKQFNLDGPLRLNVNGSLQTNRSFTPDMQGLFKWQVLANDSAGGNETLLKLFIVGTDQIIRISLFHPKDDLRTLKSQILSFMRNSSKYNFIDDGTVDFIGGDGKADPSRSVLILHAVDNDDTLISAATMQNELDHNTNLVQGLNQFQVLSIESAREAEVKSSDSIKLEYILVGIIGALVIAFLVTLTVMIANIYRFKRKLKASTVESYPMSRANTIIKLNPGTVRNNPVFGREQIGETGDDDDSRADNYSIDDNNVDNRPAKVNEVDEQEVTLDLYGTETSSPLPPRKGNKLLDEVLQEHALTSEHAENSVPKRVSNGNAYSSRFSVKVKDVTGQKGSKI